MKSVSAIIIAVLVGVLGFFMGMRYQESQIKQPSRQQAFGMMGGNGARGGQRQFNGMGFRPVVGEIISQDEKSVTVKLLDGSSKIVLMSDSTPVSKTTQATKSDLKVGDSIRVFGTTNNDGSVTAQDIQLDPPMRGTNNLAPNKNQ